MNLFSEDASIKDIKQYLQGVHYHLEMVRTGRPSMYPR